MVEQGWNNKLFNRGCLLNIAVKEYKDRSIHLITHDVDIHPLEETIEKYYIDPIPENNIKGIFTSMCNRLGGIIKLRCDTFLKNKAILVEICQSKLRVRTEELWSYAKLYFLGVDG